MCQNITVPIMHYIIISLAGGNRCKRYYYCVQLGWKIKSLYYIIYVKLLLYRLIFDVLYICCGRGVQCDVIISLGIWFFFFFKRGATITGGPGGGFGRFGYPKTTRGRRYRQAPPSFVYAQQLRHWQTWYQYIILFLLCKTLGKPLAAGTFLPHYVLYVRWR